MPSYVTPEFLAQSRTGEVYAAVIPVTCLCTFAVVLRFLARRFQRTALWWDDYLIVVALLFEYGLSTSILWATVAFNFGRHVEGATNKQVTGFLKSLMAVQTTYYCAQATIKISLLMLYYRIFGISNPFRIAVWTCAAVVFGWWLSVFFASIFQCSPVSASWDRTVPNAKCIDLTKYAYGNGVSNLLTDVMILALPGPMVMKLQVDKKSKATLMAIFLLGGFVCATSIIRLTEIKYWSLTDPTWSGVGIDVWSSVESCTAIIGACLPTFRPLFGTMFKSAGTQKGSVAKQIGSSNLGSSNSETWTPLESRKDAFSRLEEIELGTHMPNKGVTSWVTSDVEPKDPHYPGILERTTISQQVSRAQ